MNRIPQKFILLFLTVLNFATANAQSGSCVGSGTYLNYNDYINYDRSAGGDVEIDVAGYMEIGPIGVYDIYGAVINNGTIEIDNGGVLTIWGDMINNATIIVHVGGKINFYGKTWTNAPGSTVTDGVPINTVPGGDVSFIAARPVVPPSWLVLSPCLTSYSGGNALQYADGGNVPMDVTLRLQNANNVVLINTPTRIEGKLQWDVANGDIVLGNQNLVMTTNATQDGFREDRFAITNGTGHLVKENYIGNWIFPVGITDGDYTPASVDNITANTMNVLVQDYATSASAEIVGPVADGINRTWNIYADIATGNSNITLQHNSITNQALFDDAYNFVTRWSNDTPNTSGDFSFPYSTSTWQTNTPGAGSLGNLSSTGVVSGAYMRSRLYNNFATSDTAAIAFFSKSSDAVHPLPLDLLSFSVQARECAAIIQFEIAKESLIKKYQLQHSTDGRVFSTIASFDWNEQSTIYSFVDKQAVSGKNFYRLVLLESNGNYTISNTIERMINCKTIENQYVLYPNPATDFISISGLTKLSEIRVVDMFGKVLIALTADAAIMTLDINQLAAATYVVQILGSQQNLTNIKFVKN